MSLTPIDDEMQEENHPARTWERVTKELQNGEITCEEALEALSSAGYSPNLLNDDGGRWALSFDGFQNTPDELPGDMSIMAFVEAKFWKPTIREAILFTLNHEE